MHKRIPAGIIPGLFLLIFNLSLHAQHVRQVRDDKEVTFYIGAAPVLTYRYAPSKVPEGVHPSFSRSGYLHPLSTLSGHRLTRIQPPDHYHHYGIWNPWTHVLFEGDTLDFWNIGRSNATVRFSKFLAPEEDEDSLSLRVLHEHLVFHDKDTITALREIQTIRITPAGATSYIVDLSCAYQCATESPFTILEYRYGGLGWRASEAWTEENSMILTSEGLTKADADGTRAEWVLAQGISSSHFGGMAILSHPENFNHPEPVRIWPPDVHPGNVFINFAPTKNTSWTFEPGKTYTLRYRFIVFDDYQTATDITRLFQQYSATQ